MEKKKKAYVYIETPEELANEFDALLKQMDVFLRFNAVDTAVRAGAKPMKAAVMRHVPRGNPENRKRQSAKVRRRYAASRPLHTTISTQIRKGKFGAMAVIGAEFYTGRHANFFARNHKRWALWNHSERDTKVVRQFMKIAQDEAKEESLAAIRNSLVKSLEEFARG